MLVAACAHPRAPAAIPSAGIAIALYADRAMHSMAIVDDRRWVDVAGDRLVLDDVDPGVALPSLVLEAVSGPGHLAIGTCMRDRIDPAAMGTNRMPGEMPSGLGSNAVPPPPPPPPPSRRHRLRPRSDLRNPFEQQLDGQNTLSLGGASGRGAAAADLSLASSVHCAVTGAPGRYLVRLLYGSVTLGYHAEHEVAVSAPDRAHIATQLSVTTPAWRARGGEPAAAMVTAYDGLPGGDVAPTELAHGRVVLDGSIGVLPLPARDVPARVRRVLTPQQDFSAADDAPDAWMAQRRSANGDEGDALVWVWLELPGIHLAPGLLHVRVGFPGEAPHEVIVTAENRAPGEPGSAEAEAALRLPLYTDDDLRAAIQRAYGGGSETELVERFGAMVINLGPTPREVFVEEKLRPAGKRTVTNAWPGKPGLAGNTLRMKLVVSPTKNERTGFTVTYKF